MMNGMRMEINPLLLLLVLLMEVLVVIRIHRCRVCRNWMTNESRSCRRFIPTITGPTVGHGRYCRCTVVVAEPTGSVLVVVVVAGQQVENR